MQYEVVALFEKGKRKPEKVYRSERRIPACVRIHEELQTPLGRAAKVASISEGHGSSKLPNLYDASLGLMAVLALTIEGVEFIDGQMYQQIWHCRVSERQITVPWTMCPRSALDELI